MPLKEDPAGIEWMPWSLEAVELARSQGHPVLVDFTADWCLTCQTNKVTSLEIPSVRARLKRGGFVTLLGDYTQKNAAITRELKKFRRAGVPLVVVYPAEGEPLVLPELLSPSVVLAALGKAETAKN
jgi:thiol:disulfide interchange protein DsbD